MPIGRRLRIAYLLPGVDISGGAAVVFQHANRLMERGHEVLVGSTGVVSRAEWFPDQRVPVVRNADLPPYLDILIATSWPTVFDVVSKPAGHKVYFVQADETGFCRPGSPLFYAALLSYLMNINFITMAECTKKWLKTSFNKDATVIPNGIDPSVFYPVRPVEPRAGKVRVLIEGAFALPRKGMKEAFDALRGLDVEIWCVSSFGKPDSSFVYDRFFENAPAIKMREIYSSCDILLKLSKAESFGLPPLEMMACGGVCVVSRISGHEEYIRNNENALMVAPDDIRGARAAIQKLIDDRQLRERLRQNGLRTAAKRNWESSIDLLENYFSQMSEHSPGIDPIGEEVNKALTLAYEKILCSSLFGGGFQTIAHRVKRRINNQLLMRLGEKLYLHVKNNKRFYGPFFEN